MAETRKLAAILAADVSGFCRLAGSDEDLTLARLRALRSDLIDPTIAVHNGRMVKRTGDGALVEFRSVVDAVRCAIEVQASMLERNAGLPPERRIEFRIGIHLGDVVEESDGDLMGDGVNIAARLQTIAKPGTVCLSEDAYRQVRARLDLAVTDLGERELKNIASPMRAFSVEVSAPSPTMAAGSVAPPAEIGSAANSAPLNKPSIAVLPFDDMSERSEEGYFADGITEDIITGLTRFRSISVIARNSSFAFRKRSLTLAEIGRQLGASFVLEGSVRRARDRVRITAQLIEAATGLHLWAERYDRKLEDIFSVQEEVAQAIISTLVGRIHDAGLRRALRKPTASLEAYDCLLRGMAHFRGYADDDNQKAYAMFQRAVQLDPHYALAHAYLANTHLAVHGNASAPSKVLDEAYAMAMHALELDPQESNGHRVLSNVWLYRREFEACERHYRMALALNPNEPDRMMGLGYMIVLRGRHEEGLALMQDALRLNPFQPTWYNSRLGVALYSLKQYIEAVRSFLQIPTPGYWTRARLAACYGQLGRAAEAEAQVTAILQLKPDFTIADFMLRDVLLEREDDRVHLREGLVKAGLPE
jgi:adenylate cyclase